MRMLAVGRKASRRFFGIALGLGLGVFALEGGYRVLRSAGLSPTTNPALVEHDERLGWRYRAGARVRHKGRDFDVEVAINAQGFRGPDWELGARHGPRILVLGDSVAFGWGVEYEQTLSRCLERMRPDWDVVCAAVSGYGTDQRLLLLEELRARVAPDVVVDVFCDNDLFEDSSSVVYGRRKPLFVHTERGLELHGVPVPRAWLERNSQLYCALRKGMWEIGFALRERSGGDEWQRVFQLCTRMSDELGTTPLVIVSGEEHLARFVSAHGRLQHVDLRSVFAEGTNTLGGDDDLHWNAEGHEKAAAALELALRPLVP
jgi:hypothetical protein